MRYYEGNISGAQTAFETSLARKESAWALRNPGVLAMHAQKLPKAVELFLKAIALDRDSEPLKVECVEALLAAAFGLSTGRLESV
jgi:tetratricopeptide (TPR) repeat protein